MLEAPGSLAVIGPSGFGEVTAIPQDLEKLWTKSRAKSKPPEMSRELPPAHQLCQMLIDDAFAAEIVTWCIAATCKL